MDDIQIEPVAKMQPKKKGGFRKFLRWFVFIVLLIGAIAFWWKYYYPFGKGGVKSGYLNYVVYKGQLFKTYEGKLIQQGVKSKAIGTLQSNEFEFSIKSKKIYDILKLNSGKFFDLQYNEYNGVLPWRGNTVYIVDSIISMRDVE